MYYFITTEDRFAFDIKKFETKEEAEKALEETSWQYDYQAIIEGNIITEMNKYKDKEN